MYKTSFIRGMILLLLCICIYGCPSEPVPTPTPVPPNEMKLVSSSPIVNVPQMPHIEPYKIPYLKILSHEIPVFLGLVIWFLSTRNPSGGSSRPQEPTVLHNAMLPECKVKEEKIRDYIRRLARIHFIIPVCRLVRKYAWYLYILMVVLTAVCVYATDYYEYHLPEKEKIYAKYFETLESWAEKDDQSRMESGEFKKRLEGTRQAQAWGMMQLTKREKLSIMRYFGAADNDSDVDQDIATIFSRQLSRYEHLDSMDQYQSPDGQHANLTEWVRRWYTEKIWKYDNARRCDIKRSRVMHELVRIAQKRIKKLRRIVSPDQVANFMAWHEKEQEKLVEAYDNCKEARVDFYIEVKAFDDLLLERYKADFDAYRNERSQKIDSMKRKLKNDDGGWANKSPGSAWGHPDVQLPPIPTLLTSS